MSDFFYSPVRWSEIVNYGPGNFQYPDRLDHSVVKGLDTLATSLSIHPIVISDFRFPGPGSTSQHGFGRALDFWVPTLDSFVVLDAIQKSKLFSGYGMYTNEKGIESFHVDTRTTRTVSNPATWGAWKDPDKGVDSWQYVGLSEIVAKISKGAGLLVLLLVGIAFYVLTSK